MKLATQAGLACNEAHYKVVKKVGKQGDTIPAHQHPGANLVFVPVKGRVLLQIDDDKQELVPGMAATWDGKQTIQAEYLEDSEIFVCIIAQPEA